MSSAVRTQLVPPPLRSRPRTRSYAGFSFAARVADPLLVLLALQACLAIRQLNFGPRYDALAGIACLLFVLVCNGFGVYRSRWRSGGLSDASSLLTCWMVTAVVLIFLGYATKTTGQYSRIVISLWMLLAPILLLAFNAAVGSVLNRLRRRGWDARRIVVAPVAPITRRLALEFRQDRKLGTECLGAFDDRALESDLPILGPLRELPRFVSENSVDAIYLAVDHSVVEAVQQLLTELEGGPATIHLIPDMFAFDLLDAEFGSINGIPILKVGQASPDEIGGAVKRCLDVFVAAASLVLLAPFFAVIAVLIKLDTHGPVFFRQTRYGLCGRPFQILKFRTMHLHHDIEVQQASRADPRITRIGRLLRRTSLDELPQLWNVLCGSMSLVGPRPHADVHNEFYRSKIRGYMLRHTARPGMTGWAQIHGFRGETETVEKMQRRIDYDLDYIRRWSLVFDIYILLRTVPSLIRNRNAY